MNDAAARELLEKAFAELGYPRSTRALQAIGAIAKLESSYGARTNNWGSIQCGSSPPCPPDCVELEDSHADGTKYRWCYRTWPTPYEGARYLVKNLMTRGGGIVRPALYEGSALEIATKMRETYYFEAKTSFYAKAIEARGKEIARSMGEPFLLGSSAKSKGGGAVLGALAVTGALLWVTLRASKG